MKPNGLLPPTMLLYTPSTVNAPVAGSIGTVKPTSRFRSTPASGLEYDKMTVVGIGPPVTVTMPFRVGKFTWLPARTPWYCTGFQSIDPDRAIGWVTLIGAVADV